MSEVPQTFRDPPDHLSPSVGSKVLFTLITEELKGKGAVAGCRVQGKPPFQMASALACVLAGLLDSGTVPKPKHWPQPQPQPHPTLALGRP